MMQSHLWPVLFESIHHPWRISWWRIDNVMPKPMTWHILMLQFGPHSAGQSTVCPTINFSKPQFNRMKITKMPINACPLSMSASSSSSLRHKIIFEIDEFTWWESLLASIIQFKQRISLISNRFRLLLYLLLLLLLLFISRCHHNLHPAVCILTSKSTSTISSARRNFYFLTRNFDRGKAKSKETDAKQSTKKSSEKKADQNQQKSKSKTHFSSPIDGGGRSVDDRTMKIEIDGERKKKRRKKNSKINSK